MSWMFSLECWRLSLELWQSEKLNRLHYFLLVIVNFFIILYTGVPPVFCDTKRRCENVAELLAKIMLNRPEVRERILTHREHEKAALTAQLTLEVD
jgi:hypothetical protein